MEHVPDTVSLVLNTLNRLLTEVHISSKPFCGRIVGTAVIVVVRAVACGVVAVQGVGVGSGLVVGGGGGGLVVGGGGQ